MAKFDLKIATDLAICIGTGISLYYLINRILTEDNSPASRQSKESKQKASQSLARLQKENPELKDISSYEQSVMSFVVAPSELDVRFQDVGGLDDIVDELRESVIYPLTTPELFMHSTLLQAPKGVLLYGPPGCGKTMIAKALAKESGANFISIRMSAIMDKWYGESNKIVDAIFSLAQKLQPCIIFIDEIDSFLRERASADHEVTAMLKAEFMTLWDGLTSSGRILVLGATNRIHDIDSAFLRRMPKRFAVSLPEEVQRRKILKIMLEGTSVCDNFDLDMLAKLTVGFSGSDLKELCRDAALNAAREYIKNNFTEGKRNSDAQVEMRPLEMRDFFKNLNVATDLNLD